MVGTLVEGTSLEGAVGSSIFIPIALLSLPMGVLYYPSRNFCLHTIPEMYPDNYFLASICNQASATLSMISMGFVAGGMIGLIIGKLQSK